jgi:putative membrane protein
VATGLLRAFGGLEKGSAFYLQSRLFYLKMALFLAILALEMWPMVTFIGWRRAARSGARVETRRARALFQLNHVQLALVITMVFVASAMARGLW